MTAIFELYSEAGHLQAYGNNAYGLGLSAYGAVVLEPDAALHPQPMMIGTVTVTGTNPILAFKANSQVNVYRQAVSGSTYTFYLRSQNSSPVGVQYWVFDVAGQASLDNTMSDIVSALYDENGVKTFDFSMRHMAGVTAIERSVSQTIPPMGSEHPGFETTGTVNVPAGKTYAIVQSTPFILATQYDLGAYGYQDSPPPEVEYDQQPLPGMKWRYQRVESYYSSAGYTGANQITAGITEFETAFGWYSASFTPSFAKDGVSRHTIIDVTGLPSVAMPNPGQLAVNVSTTTRTVAVESLSASTTTTPSVSVSVTGGSGTYTYQWVKLDGSSAVVANGSTTSSSFSTRSTNQAVNTVLEAVWYCQVSDSQGRVGYSDAVTFRHQVNLLDKTVNTLNPSSVSVSTVNDTAWAQTNPIQVTGVSGNVTLRVERYNWSGNLDSCIVEVRTAPSSTGPWTLVGSFDVRATGLRYVDFTINNGEYFVYSVSASTTQGIKSGSFDIVGHNMTTDQGTLFSRPTTVTVDSDNNYIPADPTPNAMNWANVTASSNSDLCIGDTTTITVAGINQTIDIRATISSSTGTATDGELEIFKNGTWAAKSTTMTNGSWAQTSVVNGDTLRFRGYIRTALGIKTRSYTVTVTNQTTGAVIDTFTVDLTVDADNNHNVPDPHLDPIDYDNIVLHSNNAVATSPSVFRQFTGINQDITVRFAISNRSGSMSTATLNVHSNPTAGPYGSGGPWEHYTINALGNNSRDFIVRNGQWIYVDASGSTTSGRKDLNYTVTVTNVTTGAVIDTFTVTGTVDADNNHNVPDPTPDAMTWQNVSWSTNSNAVYGAYNAVGPTLTGINQNITLRVRCTQASSNTTWQNLEIVDHNHNVYAIIENYVVGSYVDITVANGATFIMKISCGSDMGIRSTSANFQVLNQTTGGTYLGGFSANVTVDADNNYNVPDYTVDPVSIANFAPNTTAEVAYGSPRVFQITGIDQPVTLRLTRSNNAWTGNLDYNRLRVRTGPSNGNWTQDWGTITGNGAIDFNVTNGMWVEITIELRTNSGTVTASYNAALSNQTQVQGTIGSFTFNGTVDSDNNYNIGPDYAPDAIANFAGISGVTSVPSISRDSVSRQITGITAPITLRVERYTYSGDVDGSTVTVKRGSSANGPWTTVGSFSPQLSGLRYVDFTIENGQWFMFTCTVSSSAGVKSASWEMAVWNMTISHPRMSTSFVSLQCGSGGGGIDP